MTKTCAFSRHRIHQTHPSPQTSSGRNEKVAALCDEKAITEHHRNYGAPVFIALVVCAILGISTEGHQAIRHGHQAGPEVVPNVAGGFV